MSGNEDDDIKPDFSPFAKWNAEPLPLYRRPLYRQKEAT